MFMFVFGVQLKKTLQFFFNFTINPIQFIQSNTADLIVRTDNCEQSNKRPQYDPILPGQTNNDCCSTNTHSTFPPIKQTNSMTDGLIYQISHQTGSDPTMGFGDNRCDYWGDCCTNNGYTANTACCVCGTHNSNANHRSAYISNGGYYFGNQFPGQERVVRLYECSIYTPSRAFSRVTVSIRI